MIIRNEQDQHFVSTKFIGIQQKLLNKHSRAESRFADLLRDAGFYFSREKCNYQIDNRWSFYDFIIPALDLYIEIDGPEHMTEKQQEIDFQKDRQIRAHGHKIIRYKNEEVLSADGVNVSDFLERIKAGIKKSKTKKLEIYKRYRIKDIAWAYAWQLDAFGGVIDTPNVCLYDHAIGAFYVFRRLYDVNVATSIPTTNLIKMLSREYTKKTKRYILCHGFEKCKNIVHNIFGDIDAPIIEWTFPEFDVKDGNAFVSSHTYMKKELERAIREYETPDYYKDKNKSDNFELFPD